MDIIGYYENKREDSSLTNTSFIERKMNAKQAHHVLEYRRF